MKKGRDSKKLLLLTVGVLLVVTGVLLIGYPFAKEAGEEARQQELLKLWKTELEEISFADGAVDEQGIKLPGSQEESQDGVQTLEKAIAVLKIPAIDMEQPILQGATVSHLSIAPSTVEPTDMPGSDGNFSVAGHNSRTYGRHFNRLRELAVGDEIIVETLDGSYTYSVTDTFVVEPQEVWVLEHRTEEPEITLITCDYSVSGETCRLVVKGTLVQ